VLGPAVGYSSLLRVPKLLRIQQLIKDVKRLQKVSERSAGGGIDEDKKNMRATTKQTHSIRFRTFFARRSTWRTACRSP